MLGGFSFYVFYGRGPSNKGEQSSKPDISFYEQFMNFGHYGFSGLWKADHKKMEFVLKPHDHDGKAAEVAVLAVADYYLSQAVFGVEDEAAAWSEAVNLGKQIMSAM